MWLFLLLLILLLLLQTKLLANKDILLSSWLLWIKSFGFTIGCGLIRSSFWKFYNWYREIIILLRWWFLRSSSISRRSWSWSCVLNMRWGVSSEWFARTLLTIGWSMLSCANSLGRFWAWFLEVMLYIVKVRLRCMHT